MLFQEIINGSLIIKVVIIGSGMEIVNMFYDMINMAMILCKHFQAIAMMVKAIISKRE